MINLCIIIPTLNRPKAVCGNIRAILATTKLYKNSVTGLVIRVSENGADEEKQISEKAINNLIEIAKDQGIELKFTRRQERIGLGHHMNALMLEVTTEWQLWLGDDDFLLPPYLHAVFNLVLDPKTTGNAGFSRYKPVTEKTYFAQCNKVLETTKLDTKPYKFSYLNDVSNENMPERIRLTMRGNQLSGLLFRTTVVKDCLPSISKENLYPWITLMGQAIERRDGIYEIAEIGVYVTGDTPKLFSYGVDGLQGEISEAIISIPSLDPCEARFLTREVLANWLSFWRMRHTARSFIGQLARTVGLLWHPKIPFRVSVFSVPRSLQRMIWIRFCEFVRPIRAWVSANQR